MNSFPWNVLQNRKDREEAAILDGGDLGNFSYKIPIPKLPHCWALHIPVSIHKAYMRLGPGGCDRCTLTFLVSICIIWRLVFVDAVKALTSPVQVGGSWGLIAAARSWHPRGPGKPEIAREKSHHYCTLQRIRRREVRARKSWWETHRTGSSTTYFAENDGLRDKQQDTK